MADHWTKIIFAAILAASAPAHAQEAQDADGGGQAATQPQGGADAPLAEEQGEQVPEGGAQADGADGGAVAGDTPRRSVGGTDPAPGELAMGEEVGDGEPQVGSTYIAQDHGDWQQRCVRTETGADPCQLYQLLRDEGGNAVAEISIFGLPEGQQAAAGATVITPLETLLTRQLTLSVDQGAAQRYPFTFCAENGCFARIGFTAAEVAAFRRGREATMVIVPAAAPDQEIPLSISLNGFTAGFEAVNAANEANREAEAESAAPADEDGEANPQE